MLTPAVWLLVVAPMLCRSGTLSNCCTDSERPNAGPACCDGGDTGTGDEQPCPLPAERDCGSCADVCRGVAMPAADRDLIGLIDHLLPWGAGELPERLTGSISSRLCARDYALDERHMPFPASDLPLQV
jgi:hypothetical protein